MSNCITKWWNKNPFGVVFNNLKKLAGGSLLAQIMMIASTPLLAFIYSPADFGAYAGFVALSAIIASFSTLRLDVLVPLVDKTKTMSAFLQICVSGPYIFCRDISISFIYPALKDLIF